MWDTLNIYAQQDPRWFETLDRYAPGPEHLAIYREHILPGWELTRRSWWFISHPPGVGLADQGWKLHLSSHHDHSPETLRRALPVLVDARVPFKFLLDPHCVAVTSGKRWPRGSSGKFVTIYPDDDEEFVALARKLTRALAGMAPEAKGPYILSDRRAPDSDAVYYRYGGFKAIPRTRPDGAMTLMIRDPAGGEIVDRREPFYAKPDWATDPFGEPEIDTEVPLLADGRFTITDALTYSNAGGVYTGIDNQTGAEVVLKEARPGVLVGRSRIDATDALAREYRILSELADTGHFVRPVTLFSQWEHAFLVEERVDGEQMSQRSIATNPILTTDLRPDALRAYYAQQQSWWLALVDAITAAHERGILLGDLSFTNVLVRSGDDRLVVIDLETAVRIGTDEPVGLHTPGVSSTRAIDTGVADHANDFHGLGALMLGSVMLVNAAVGYDNRRLPRFLAALTDDLRLPGELTELIADLLDPAAPPAGPDPALIRKRIAGIDFAAYDGWRIPVPLSLPAKENRHPDPAATIRRCRDVIVAAADTKRRDRLFPAHVMVHETNPLSLAYGAAGVLHALHQLGDPVPDHLRAWLLTADLPRDCPPGLYTGTAGVAWVLDELGQPAAARRSLVAATEHELFGAEHGILAGTAGIGLACLRLWHTGVDGAGGADRAELLALAVGCGERIAASAVHGERGPHWPVGDELDPSSTTVPVGYGRGASGIALFLLYLAEATGEPGWRELGRAALGHDLAYAVAIRGGDGEPLFDSFPGFVPPGGEDVAVVKSYWDEGTAGVATALLRYLAVAPDDELRAAWSRMRRDLCRKYAIMPQLFHGLAGSGMALLDAAELLRDQQALDEAWRVGEGVLLFGIETGDGVSFPGEQCLRESTDLATGAAGVLLFLDRLRRAGPGERTNTNFVLDELLGEERNAAGQR